MAVMFSGARPGGSGLSKSYAKMTPKGQAAYRRLVSKWNASDTAGRSRLTSEWKRTRTAKGELKKRLPARRGKRPLGG
jgi:DNA-binding PadR family transcriptional regulator